MPFLAQTIFSGMVVHAVWTLITVCYINLPLSLIVSGSGKKRLLRPEVSVDH